MKAHAFICVNIFTGLEREGSRGGDDDAQSDGGNE